MRELTLTKSLSGIDQRFVYEAETSEITCRNNRGYRLLAAACFVLLCGLALPRLLPQQKVLPSLSPEEQPITEQTGPVTLTLGTVYWQDVGFSPDRAFSLYFLEKNKEQIWSPAQTRSYYGGELTPPWLPEDLRPATGNGYACMYVGEGGEIAAEFFTLQFYEAYYEDGSPKAMDGTAIPRGIRLSASRTGIWRDCILLRSEDTQQVTYIGEIPVQLGYRQMSHGPYDPETHAPAGYYDLYVAEFEKDGVEYELISEKLGMEEFLTVLSSVILERGTLSLMLTA